MTRQRLNAVLAAILTTLDEVGGWSPASSIYMALGMDITSYQEITAMMAGAGLVTLTSETVTLTDKGRELAQKCKALVAE